MPPIHEITIAARDDVFDALFTATTRIAELDGDPAAADVYLAKLDRLRDQVVAVSERLFEPDFREKHLYIDWDSWPNHTCAIDATVDSFSQPFFDALRGLLVDEYQDWRIQVIVYADLRDGHTMIGSVAISPDRLLIDRALYAITKWRGLNFHCNAKPIWRKPAKS